MENENNKLNEENNENDKNDNSNKLIQNKVAFGIGLVFLLGFLANLSNPRHKTSMSMVRDPYVSFGAVIGKIIGFILVIVIPFFIAFRKKNK